MVRVSLVVLGHISLMLTSIGRCPGSSSILVQTPTLPIVDSGVLFSGNRSVYFLHRLDDKSDMVLFAHSLEEGTSTSIVRSQQGSGTGSIDIVRWVAERSDTWKIGSTTSTNDGWIKLLPESSLV
jgi:hypothetical protein